jgi:hypothetical protein
MHNAYGLNELRKINKAVVLAPFWVEQLPRPERLHEYLRDWLPSTSDNYILSQLKCLNQHFLFVFILFFSIKVVIICLGDFFEDMDMADLEQIASLDTPEDAKIRARMLKKTGKLHVDPYRNLPVNDKYTDVRAAFAQEMGS